jgi:glutaminyl-tRNA synthetase
MLLVASKMTEIVTRFTPEPNSYTHVGHTHSMEINFDKHPGCKCILRMDDTNPEAEKQEFVDGIIDDVKWLGYKPWKITYTSDYYDDLYKYAIDLIKNGKAYVDLTNAEEMSKMRHEGTESKYRSMDPEWHLTEFENMRKGKYEEGKAVLRLKIDMQNNNHTLRDPIAYRIKYTPHYKTGNKWCIYPSYDYSHGIVDALENITYSYCTMEYYVRREQYYWPVLELIKLGHKLKPADVTEFGKLTVQNNILSKRNINKLVESKLVSGFDDPRLFNLKGMRRRGYTPTVIRNIVKNAGMERHDTEFTVGMIEYYLRKELNETSPRAFAVVDPVRLEIKGFDKLDCDHPNHPINKSMGSHNTLLTKNVFIDASDFKEVDEKDYYRLAPGKTIRLRYGPFVKYVSHDKKVIICETTEPDKPKKIKGVIHWVSEEDSTECIFELYSNMLDEKGDFDKNSLVVKRGRVESSVMKDLTKTYQFERVGYFKFDRYEGSLPVFIRVIDLVDKYNP